MISIIIPLYNGENVIDKCLNSVLLSSKHLDCEVLIVDDGSCDESIDRVKKYLCDNVILFGNRKNLGFARTVMKGIEEARGEFVVFLNMDTIVENGWLKELIKPLKEYKTVGITGSKMFYIDNNNLQHAGGFLTKNALSYHIGEGERDLGQYDKEREVEYVCGASLACKKDILKKLGGLDFGFSPLYYEEIDIAYRFRKAGYTIMYIPSSNLKHYGEYTLQNNSREIFYFASRNRIRYILKTYSIRRFLFEFICHEVRYFIKINNRNKLYLLKAYVYNVIKFPEILFSRFKDRILIYRFKMCRVI